LLAGRLGEAWPGWERRFEADRSLARPMTAPLWRGEPLAGRTLLIYAEQGIGSALQFCRYLRLIPPGGQVVLEVHRSLVRLLRQLPIASVVAVGDQLPAHDLRCPMLSLPAVLGTNTLADIPAAVPYLQADPALMARWHSRAAGLTGLRVGLVWAGNPINARMDRRRSIPLTSLTGLGDIPGVSLVSLQVGAAAAELANSPLAATTHDWTSELTDFAETAALVEPLDLVVGVDTAVVHIAGALGTPVWLLNRADTDWRWLLGRDDSPWYPTLRQFRQARAGDWDSVVAPVAAALKEAAARPSTL
jgi:hypothetical protein